MRDCDAVLTAGRFRVQELEPIDEHGEDFLIRRAVPHSAEHCRLLDAGSIGTGRNQQLLNKLEHLPRSRLLFKVFKFVTMAGCEYLHRLDNLVNSLEYPQAQMSRRYLSTENCLTCDGTGKQYSREKINAVIDKSGLSLQEVADALGITKSYLSSLRSGRRPWATATSKGNREPTHLVRKLEGILKK